MTTETTAEAREWRIGGAVQRWPPEHGPHRIWIDEVGRGSDSFGSRWVAEARTRAEAEQMIRWHNSHDALVAALEWIVHLCGTENEAEFHHTLKVGIPDVAGGALKIARGAQS